MNGRRAAGFTLLEVMVALAIVAVAFGALLSAMMQATANATHGRERLLSHYVAANMLTELQVMQVWETGQRHGTVSMGGQVWHYRAEIRPTPNARLHRVDVYVYAEAEADHPVSTLMGLLAHPESSGGPGTIAAEAAQ